MLRKKNLKNEGVSFQLEKLLKNLVRYIPCHSVDDSLRDRRSLRIQFSMWFVIN